MGWLKAAFGPVGSVSDHNSWLIRQTGGIPTNAGTRVSEHTALNITAVYSAVGIIADLIAMLPLRVFQSDGERRNRVFDHPVAAMFSGQPNPLMTPYTLKQTSMNHTLLWGNGYGEIQRNGRGQAVGIWPLLPDRTWPEKNTDNPDRGPIVYRTNVDGDVFSLNDENVFHCKAMGHDGLIGFSPITMHREALGLALATEEFGAKFFKNDAKSGGFLQFPPGVQLSDDAVRNLQQSIEQKKGLDNAHRVKILEDGAKFISTTIPPEDAQFLGTREFQIAEIARIFRVPLILLASHEKATSWGTGIEQFLLGFLRFTLHPWVSCWEEEANRKLFTPSERAAGFHVRFALKEMARGDMQARSKFYKDLWEVGALSPNEIREFEDMNRGTDDLNKHFRPKNFQPIDEPDQDAQGFSQAQAFREQLISELVDDDLSS